MMSFRPVARGTVDRSWSLFWINQWPEWFEELNWRNFTFVQCSVEHGSYKGRYIEIEVVLLGLGFVFEWWDRSSRAAFHADMDQRISEAREQMGLTDDGEDSLSDV